MSNPLWHSGGTNCCCGCQKRVVGCHATCPEYAEYRAKKDAELKARREYNEAQEIGYGVSKRHPKRSRR